MAQIKMPRLSDSMEEGTIVRWLVGDGTEVAAGDALAEIETDKATMTFEAEAAGVLSIGATEGDTVAVGAVIATLGEDDDRALGGAETSAAPTPTRTVSDPPTRTVSDPPTRTVSDPPTRTVSDPPARTVSGATDSRGRVRASPVARRIAGTLGIDLVSLVGSGPQGRIVKRDVESARGEPSEPTNDVSAAPDPPAPATSAAEPLGGRDGEAVRSVELTRAQRTVARRMAQAKSTMPEFTVSVSVDMDAAVQLRTALKEAAADRPAPSVNDFVIKAAALALRTHPKVNGAYRDDHFELFSHVNVGVALALDGALLVPVVSDADRCSLTAIAAQTRRLAAAGRAGTLTAADLSGATFSVSNLGMFGVSQFTAVLNPPQAAILAVGALEQLAVVRDGAIVPGWRMTLTLTCDHRILYGADAAAFLNDVRGALEQPARLAF